MKTVAEAQAAIIAALEQPLPSVILPLLEASGRVLAIDVSAPTNVPPCDNSAMDGYALRVAELAGDIALPILLRCCAGDAPTVLPSGGCARIFTGAPLPVGADAVVIQEDSLVEGDHVRFTVKPDIGDNIRRRGEDIASGSVLHVAGRRLRPADIGVLASVGISTVAVSQRPVVALMSTGNELVEPGEPLQPGQIYNSNRYHLAALLREAGCDVLDGGRLPDDLAQTTAHLEALSQQAHVVLSTGGVSAGEEDYVHRALDVVGNIDLWKIAMKPGKPLLFGHIGRTAVFGLPGNPVSAGVTFQLFVKPYLRALQGETSVHDDFLPVQAAFAWTRPGKREEYVRVRLQRHDNSLRAVLYPHQGSGVLSSMAWASALARIPAGATVAPGDSLDVLLLGPLEADQSR